MRSIGLIFILVSMGICSFAQSGEFIKTLMYVRSPQPFLFSATTLTAEDLPWSLDYSSSFGKSVSGPFGVNGLGQQLGVQGYLGRKFTLMANNAFSYTKDDNIQSAQQVELIRDFLGDHRNRYRLGAGLGAGRDFSGIASLLGRVTFSYNARQWEGGYNLLLQKSFGANRDKIDIISSIGFHHRITGLFFGGVEAVGEDLEGFWDPEEAEGGARMLIGPSVNMTSPSSRISFSFSGGPVFYATRSTVLNPVAIRELPAQAGLSLRAKLVFKLSD